jgi:hypothetical protein
MEHLTKNNLGQWTLVKGKVKENTVECSGEGCNKKILRSSGIPLANFVIDKATGKQVRLSTRKWLCESCFEKQSQQR